MNEKESRIEHRSNSDEAIFDQAATLVAEVFSAHVIKKNRSNIDARHIEIDLSGDDLNRVITVSVDPETLSYTVQGNAWKDTDQGSFLMRKWRYRSLEIPAGDNSVDSLRSALIQQGLEILRISLSDLDKTVLLRKGIQ